MAGAVSAVCRGKAEVVARFSGSGCHTQVFGGPVPPWLIPVQVAAAVLHEDAQRLAGHAGDEVRVGTAVRHLREAGQTSDDAADAAKPVRAQPCGGEGAVAAVLPPQMPHLSRGYGVS